MGIFQQFPYSNFHEMNLDEIIKIMRQMQDEWAATSTEWASYKDFIDNYFANLDVSDEVLETMRVFAADGTLNSILDPVISADVSAWLLANIGPTTPAIDTSFSVSGAGADSKTVGDTILHYKNTSPGEFSNELARVNKPRIFIIGSGAAWTDKPKSVGVFKNELYNVSGGDLNFLQTFYSYPDMMIYRRMVVNNVPAMAWQRIEDSSVTPIAINNDNVTYGRILANLNINTICPLTAANWDDLPEDTHWKEPNTTYILINQTYNSPYFVQRVLTYPAEREYVRIVNTSNGTVAVPWKLINGSIGHQIYYYAIGDSLTSGSYSDDNAQSVVGNNEEWAYPKEMQYRYGCVSYNLAVAGARLNQMASQANNVTSYANLVTIMGGVNDYLQGTPLGAVGEVNLTTVAGSLATLIETCITNAPNARIVIISPLLINRGSAATNYSANYNYATFTMEQLNTVYKDTAEKYNIEFIDGLHGSPINYRNITGVITDGTHPTIPFYTTIANWIGSKLF